ncbi:AAA family ATPase [candidate division KSB1 bacterium]|nr:AAA family ATPase [candidate division KSB1 bacterium]
MKISIQNFKSIKSLQNFEIKPFTILSGVNSSGKSSLIQLLLLLKQTIELDSTNETLYLKGKYYKVREFLDLIYDKNPKNNLKISFEFHHSEFTQIGDSEKISLFNSFGNYQCLTEIQYDTTGSFINQFSVTFNFLGGKKQYIKFKSDSQNVFSIKTNTGVFGSRLFAEAPAINKIQYLSIYPNYYEGEIELELKKSKAEDN